MSKIPVYVGLDYHQGSVQVCVLDQGGAVLMNRSCPNELGAVVAAAERCGRVVRAAVESCSGAADFAEAIVSEAGWSVDLCHPGYANRMRSSPDKSDLSDARLLADLTRVGYLPRVWLAPRCVRELRCLTRHRQGLINERRAAKLRLRSVLREQRQRGPGRAWTIAWMHWLRRDATLSEQGRWVVERLLEQLEWLALRITQTERRLHEATREDGVVRRLRALPGVGPVTSWVLRAEIGRFDRFASGKQLARFCGLSPRNASSGTRQADAGLVKAGNAQLRATLLEAAHRLARHDPRWHAFAESLLRRGKAKNVVAAAVANRWMRWMHHQMKDGDAIMRSTA